jgi:hypothetical protein
MTNFHLKKLLARYVMTCSWGNLPALHSYSRIYHLLHPESTINPIGEPEINYISKMSKSQQGSKCQDQGRRTKKLN